MCRQLSLQNPHHEQEIDAFILTTATAQVFTMAAIFPLPPWFFCSAWCHCDTSLMLHHPSIHKNCQSEGCSCGQEARQGPQGPGQCFRTQTDADAADHRSDFSSREVCWPVNFHHCYSSSEPPGSSDGWTR